MNPGYKGAAASAKAVVAASCLHFFLLSAPVHALETIDHAAGATQALPPGQAATAVTTQGYVLQVAAFRNLVNARGALAKLDAPGAEIVLSRKPDGDLYVIIAGRFTDRASAKVAGEEFASRNPGADYWVPESTGFTPLTPVSSTFPATQENPGSGNRTAGTPRPASVHANETRVNGRQGGTSGGSFVLKADELWAEYDYFPDHNSAADQQQYLHGQASANWVPANPAWEFQLSGRVDGYYQQGRSDSDNLELDYGESFIRFAKNKLRVTVGAQTVMWGRIDEFPPTDRLSTQDISRYVLDDLEKRRRASMAVHVEYYDGNSKLEVLAIPFFRAAELPDKHSVWFPINQETGEIFGLKTTPQSSAIIRNATIDLEEPDSEGGIGLRYSGLTPDLDYGISVQRGRQTLPYFVYDPATQVIETDYPRTWILGGDVGMEALGGTLRFELTWLSDTPVTSLDGSVSNVDSVSWGGGYEFFPGDGDARINLQLMGNNLFDASQVLDRTDIYAFTGSFETPFANETWRFRTRFYLGLDKNDAYLNPEIAYKGWPSQELYLETHYFQGSDGTPGGFHQDHSLIGVGWRNQF